MVVRRVDLANWALRTSPKFTTGLNISPSGFVTRSEIQKSQSPFAPMKGKAAAKCDQCMLDPLLTLNIQLYFNLGEEWAESGKYIEEYHLTSSVF